MKKKKKEVPGMTNKQTVLLLEALKIIAEQAKDKQEIKNALDRLQDVMKNPK